MSSWYNTRLLSIPTPVKWRNTVFDCVDLNVIDEKLQELSKKRVIFPAPDNVYKALEMMDPLDVKVVILGQDPYASSSPDLATGLAFSVPKTSAIPSSLQNIFKELESDGFTITKKHDDLLEGWARQSVLLLNTSLTVSEKEPGGH